MLPVRAGQPGSGSPPRTIREPSLAPLSSFFRHDRRQTVQIPEVEMADMRTIGHRPKRRRAWIGLVGAAATLAALAGASSVLAAGATITDYAYSSTYTTSDPQD